MFFKRSNNHKTHSILAHEQAPEWSRVKKKISEPSELNLGYRRKKDGRACRLCFDAAHPGYQILLHDLIGHIDDSWQVSDDYWMNIFLIPWKIPTCTWMLLKPIHWATKKKHYNLTGLICTLLTCYRPMCYRINASVWIHGIKTKPSGFCTFFSPPGHAWLESFADFFCTAPLRSLFADYINTIYTILQFARSSCYWYWSHLLMPVWYSSRFHSLPLLILMTTVC